MADQRKIEEALGKLGQALHELKTMVCPYCGKDMKDAQVCKTVYNGSMQTSPTMPGSWQCHGPVCPGGSWVRKTEGSLIAADQASLDREEETNGILSVPEV